MKLAIPSALASIVEYMGFEMVGIVSSYISVDANAALFITINMLIVIYMIAFGFSQAATTLVGQYIGSMEIEKAKHYTRFILKISLVFAALISLTIFLLRRQIALFYTDIESVISLTEISLSYLALIHLFDFNYTVL